MAKTDTANSSSEIIGPNSVIATHHKGNQYCRPTEGKAIANAGGFTPKSKHAKARKDQISPESGWANPNFKG